MNIKKLLLILVLLVPIQAIAQAVIIVPGGWSVQKGYIVTTPTGDVLACGQGEFRTDLAPGVWSLECDEFNPEPYMGYPDSSLRKG